MSADRQSLPAALARHGILLITCLFALLPFLWMMSMSVKSPGEMFSASFSLWPEQFSAVQNYTAALTAAPLARYMLNGIFVCSAVIVLQLLICAPCAYALAKLRFTGRDAAFSLVLIALLIPHHVLALPLFVACYWLGILDSYAALILPYIVSPFGIFLLRQFFKSIPDDLVHAARLDGMSELSIVFRIMVPMALPAVAAFVIFSAVGQWNSLFWPLIVIQSETLMPPSQGIVAFHNAEVGVQYGPLMAASVLIVAPLIAAFLFAQRRFIEGLTLGGVK